MTSSLLIDFDRLSPACPQNPVTNTFLALPQVTVSFLVASSFYTSETSVGSIHVTAPLGFSFPTVCQVAAAGLLPATSLCGLLTKNKP